MKKSIHVGNVSIPMDEYVIGGTALLDIRDSGKTYAAKGIAEQILDAKIPIIVFDPVGRWRFMKLAGDDSKRPKGYKIVVAGGEQPDLPLTPQSAPEIVRAAIRENIPLVVDLWDRRLSKADWRRIVQACIRIIFYENKGLRHVFLEESPEFAPQKVIDGETYAEVEKLVRMGGNVSIGVTLIGQRPQEINKAVLDLCGNLILMKQRGAHAIEAVEKWMDKLSPETAAEVARVLPHMGAGDAWIFTPDQEEPRRVQTAPLRSFHPDRRKPQLSARAAAARTTDTVDFVSRLSGVLETVIAEATANDPAPLRRRIVELERVLKSATAAPAPAPVDTSAIAEKAFQAGRTSAVRDCRAGFRELLNGLHLTMDKAVGSAFDPVFQKAAAIGTTEQPVPLPAEFVSKKAQVVPLKRQSVSPPADRFYRESLAPSDGVLSKGEAAIMRALLTLPGPASRESLTVMTGYKKSTRDEYLKRLAAKGFVEIDSIGIQPTIPGREALGNFEPMPHGEELRAFWYEKLPLGERKLLELLVAAHPLAVPRDGLDEAGYKKSSRNEYLKRLQSRQLITEAKGGVRASDILF